MSGFPWGWSAAILERSKDLVGKKAEIAVDQIRAISKRRLRRRIDNLLADEAVQLRRLITEMYGE